MTRPFRFAVQIFRGTKSSAEFGELVRRIEDLGYSTLFLADHYLGKGPATQKARQLPQYLAPITAMATAAALTRTLRVGSRVFCMDYHVPAVLAKEAATLDVLSDGRLEFGIGAGWSEHEYAAMGLTMGPPGQRVAKLQEVVALFKAHCSGEMLEIDGEHVTATGYTGLPLPSQRPHPPIMIGGAGKRVLSFAAREADIVSINNVDYDAVNAAGLSPQGEAQRRIAWVREAAGDRFDQLDIEASPFFTVVTDDPSEATTRITSMIGVAEEGFVDHPNVLIGTAEELADRLQERREAFGVNYVTIQQTDMESFVPVVERLAGR
ncbi:MAG: TIGR03621 family F420-dependent LLM class oxidoreductase [Acidimicrobiales bacterium]